jgi:hypothetical protein
MTRFIMRVVRAGSAITFSFRKRVLPAVLLAALLALACGGARILRGQKQAASVPVGASALVRSAHDSGTGPDSQPATQPDGAGAGGPNQEIGELFEMATALKAEVAKTNQDMLSISVVRKAASIEQLAHKMRTGGGGR